MKLSAEPLLNLCCILVKSIVCKVTLHYCLQSDNGV